MKIRWVSVVTLSAGRKYAEKSEGTLKIFYSWAIRTSSSQLLLTAKIILFVSEYFNFHRETCLYIDWLFSYMIIS